MREGELRRAGIYIGFCCRLKCVVMPSISSVRDYDLWFSYSLLGIYNKPDVIPIKPQVTEIFPIIESIILSE